MNVAAVIVTRGDVDLAPVLDSLPSEWEHVIWDNGRGELRRYPRTEMVTFWRLWHQPDLSVYGRYAAIEHTGADLIFVVDDDVIVSDPQAIVDAWQPGHVVCNMPAEFRPHYPDSALIGFGACFERDLPERAFDSFWRYDAERHPRPWITGSFEALGTRFGFDVDPYQQHFFYRECDAIFTCLTPRIFVDVPKTDREFASDPDRLWKQSDHHAQRQRMLELARQVRDRVPA